MTANPDARAKGPPVFLDYDQAELDRCYDQANWSPNMDIVHRRTDAHCEVVRQRLGAPQRLAYGDATIEKLDLFRARVAAAPTLIYVHGGAWRSGASDRCHGPAEMFVEHGSNYIALDFDNVIDTGGDLLPIIDQVRRAMVWIYRNAATFSADADKLYIYGHSSGAHLVGNVLTTDWATYGAPQTILKGGMVTSGMFELAPVRLSARSKYVNFNDAMVEQLSSIRNLRHLNCPVVVSYGDQESPEFQRQSEEFAAAVAKAGGAVKLQVGVGLNHFEIAETLANPYSFLGRSALELIGAKGAAK